MLSKFNLLIATLLFSVALYAAAQQGAGKAGTQAGDTKAQTGKAQNTAADTPARSAEGQIRTETGTGEAPTRGETQTRTRESQTQTRTGEARERPQTGEAEKRTRRTTTREYRRSDNDQPLDSLLASCLLLGNQNEVAISQFAAERAKNEKVQEFAREMVEAHSQAITQLQRFAAPELARDGRSVEPTRTERSETRVNERSPQSETDRPRSSKQIEQRSSSPAGQSRSAVQDRSVTTSVEVRSEWEAMPDRLLAIERQVSEKFVTMCKAELEQSGDFDQAYLGQQVCGHMVMIAKLETYQSYVSEELGQVVKASLQTAQEHLRHANELIKEIGAESSGNVRRDSGVPREPSAVREKPASKR